MATSSMSIILALIAAVIGAFAAVMIKKGSSRLTRNFFRNIKNWRLILGGILYIISSVFFVVALKHGELSVLYPMIATQYIWVSVLSSKLLKEKINLWKWLGITFIIFGVVLIGIGGA